MDVADLLKYCFAEVPGKETQVQVGGRGYEGEYVGPVGGGRLARNHPCILLERLLSNGGEQLFECGFGYGGGESGVTDLDGLLRGWLLHD